MPLKRLFIIPAALLALVACRGDERSRADAELSRDLSLAASDGLGMAPTPSTQVVSAIEGGPPAPVKTPETRKAPKRGTARPRTHVVQATARPTEEKVFEPSPEPTAVAAAPEPTTTAPEPAPVATPRPTPMPLPTGEGDSGYGDAGSDAGRVIGTVIGVVIRGGGIGDDDHCEIHPRGGRGGVLINDRIPVGRIPRVNTGGTWGGGTTTFPRY
ncbi:MAG TPA: hypothetical protein VFS05_06505 [Gemmatimonadaceae bacterium]|nr:hypothetical protein [Gemmatimonadaceae bacterium]